MTVHAITMTFLADFADTDNAYDPGFSDLRHFGEALEAGRITQGDSVYVELGGGYVVKAELLSIAVSESRVVATGHVRNRGGAVVPAQRHENGAVFYCPLPDLDGTYTMAKPAIAETFVESRD